MFKRPHLLFVFVLFVMAGLWSASLPASAAALSSSQAEVTLEQFLSKNGEFRAPNDFVGSIDPTGFQLISASGETPRFARIPQNNPQSPLAGADNANWSPTFGVPGAVGLVRSMLWDGTNLYVGGTFSAIGGVAASQIARWNGSSWSALGAGTNGSVLALAWDGTNLYAGGNFTSAGGNPAARIAQWNGSTWSALGSGMNVAGSIVFALAWDGSNLFAGGNFTSAGGNPAARIARWNGSTWSALGAGFTSGAVRALAWDGTNLYAGGTFTTPISRIARWDGSTWTALGTGVNNSVLALAWDGSSNLYVGGSFTTPASRVARWDGTAWSALGGGVDSNVNALNWNGSELFVGGQFANAGGSPASRIARWNGSSWSTLGNGVNNNVFALAWDSTSSMYNNLYAGGDFTTAGINLSNFIADWRLAAIWDGGGVDNNGSTAANWSGDVVPSASDVAIFDSTSFKDATLDGAFTPTLEGLIIEDSYAGTVTHNNNLVVTSDLLAHGGTFVVADPATFSLTVGGAVINTGAIFQQTRPVNTADVPFLQISDGGANIKYRGVEVDITGTAANLGNVTARIRVVDRVTEYCTQTGGVSPVYAGRCYEITPVIDGAANVQLWSLASELYGIDPNDLAVYRDTDGTGNWVLLANRTVGSDGGAYRYSTGDTPGFSHFLMGDVVNTPTAVTLQTFTTTNSVIPIFLILVTAVLVSATFTFIVWQRRKA